MTVKSMEKLENSKVSLVIEVDAATFDAAINKVYHKQKGRISVPGFRKGKVPRKIIEGMYGANVFYEDAVEEVYPEALEAAVKEKDLQVVAYPEVDVKEMSAGGVVFEVKLTTKPEVTLGAYKGVEAERAEVSVSDEDIEQELEPLIRRATRIAEADKAAELGDTVVIDFKGLLDGVPFDGGTAEGHSLELGSNSFVPGFEAQLVGAKAGDERNVNITFPEDYVPDLAGKEVVFEVKVHSVKEQQKPELDDEFAKDVSEFDTLEELKKDLGEKLQARRESDAQQAFESNVMEVVTGNMSAEIPDEMVDYEADRLMQDFAQRIQGQGMRVEDYLSMMGMSTEAFREDAKRTALKRIKNDLALEAVIAAEELTVTEEDLEAEYAKLAEQYSMELDKVKEAVNPEALESDIKYSKASKLLIESAVAVKPAEKPQEPEQAEETGEAEEAPAKKPVKKTATKKAKSEDGEEKPAPKRTRKKKEEEEV